MTQEDFVGAIEELTEAVRLFKFPALPATARQAAPVVHVAAPEVNIAPSKFTLPPIEVRHPQTSYLVKITKRDFDGRIQEMTIIPER